MADTLHDAGIPETVMLLDAPAGLLSGIGTLIGPDVKFTDVAVDEELVKRTAGSPKHIVTDVGVTVGGGGVYCIRAVAVLLQPVVEVNVPVTV